MNEHLNPFGRKLTAEETRMIFMGSAGGRHTDDKEEAEIPQPPPALPDLDPRYLAGCALVARRGSLDEVALMTARRDEVRTINRQTNEWLAGLRQEAA